MASNNKRNIKTDLDGWINNKKYKAHFNLNGKIFKILDEIDVFYAEIEGERPENLTIDELFAYAASRLGAPSAILKINRNGFIQNYLVSTEEIEAISFIRKGYNFNIHPQEGCMKLNRFNKDQLETLRQLAHASIKRQLTIMGFVHARTKYGRHSKDYIVNDVEAIEVHSQKAFFYHIFEGIIFRVYIYEKIENKSYFLIALDTKRPVYKSSRKTGKFSDLIDNSRDLDNKVDGFVSTADLPNSISRHVTHIRKCDAQERYTRALKILSKLNLNELTNDAGEMFKEQQSNSINYIKSEPEFLFGSKKCSLDPDQIFKEFLLTNLKKYGPFKTEGFPKVIKVKLLYMAQLPERYRIKMVEGLSKLKIQFEDMYKIELKFVGIGTNLLERASELPEVDSDVEYYCDRNLRKQFKEHDFDIVINVLYGDQYNHPFRRAIKKGLQEVPSQTLKHLVFKSPTMFADIYKTSISAQLLYKAKGIIPTPVLSEYLNNFKVRVYYDVGHKKLPGASPGDNRIFSIVGVVSLIADEKVYKFTKQLKVNDYSSIETTKGEIVRELLRLSVKNYLDESGLDKLDGNILVQRDGIYGVEEPGPALDEINSMRNDGIIPSGTKWAFVEFIKDTPIRLFSHEVNKEPQRGTYFHLSLDRAFLSTTGYPDIHPKAGKNSDESAVGVARTLEIRRIAASDASHEFMDIIIQDVYYRTFLWNATFSKTRHIAEANMVHEIFDLSRQGVTKFPKWVC